jgi:protein-disulfide isomerase
VPPSAPTRRARRASPRALAVAGGLVAVATVAVVLGVVLSGGSSKPSTAPEVGTLRNALPGAREVDALFRGIPQQGLRLGRAAAPVTVVEYLDLQCPYCREIQAGALPGVIAAYVRPGKAKLVLRPLAFVGPDSVRGRNALIAAGSQGRAFNLAHLLYANQGVENTGWLDEGMVTAAAASIPGLHVRTLLDERAGARVSKLAAQYDGLAVAAGVNSTPTFVVGGSFAGKKTTLVAPSEAALAAAIDASLGVP